MSEAAKSDWAGKLPPQSLEAEQSVLGGVLIENESLNEVLQLLRPDDFYQENHRAIFQALIELNSRGEPADLVTVSEYLSRNGALEKLGGVAYISTLVDSVPTTANIASYAKIVKDKSILRELIRACGNLTAECTSEQSDVDDFLDRAEGMIFNISQRRNSGSFAPLKDVLQTSFRTIETLQQNRGQLSGLSTGYKEFDKLTNGLQRSDLIIVAARPSMGKTALALNIAQYAALEAKIPVAIFSLEMSKEQIGLRLLCSEGRIDNTQLRKGELGDDDWMRLTRVAGRLSESKIFIDDSAALTGLEMKAKARRLKSAHNLGLVVVDYLQLMRSERRNENRVQEISEISMNLKALAKELQIPVIALSQLNRGVDSRDNKRPQMSDLRESGAIEQDADLIAFIYRDEIYNPESPDRGLAEVIIAKHRNGPTGKFKLAFLGQYTRFEDLAYEYQE